MDNDSFVGKARVLQVAVGASVIVIALLYIAARLRLSAGQVRLELGGHGGVSPLPWASDVGMLFLVLALCRLAQMLGLLASGALFTAAVIRRFRGFAFWLMLSALVGVFGPLAAELLGVGGESRRFPLDLRALLMLVVTFFLFLLARLLERGRELEEEAREIV